MVEIEARWLRSKRKSWDFRYLSSLQELGSQGEELKSRIKKVCEGYHASIYPCPELLEERREMLVGVETRLEDLDRILKETNDHRQSFLKDKVSVS